MTAMELHRCPGPETLASFVEGTLPRTEVATVVRHLQGCGECRDIVGDVVEFERDEANADAEAGTAEPAPLRPRRWWIPAAAAAVLALGISTLFVVHRNRDPLQELIAAAARAKWRPVEARVAAFPHAKFRDLRNSETLSNEDSHFDGPAAQVLAQVGSNRAPGDLQAAGIAYLVTGDASTALAKLREAARLEPRNDAILSDLAAAQIANGDLRGALTSTEQALAVNPSSAAAQFNRALAFEKGNDTVEARLAWSRYLELDGTGRWADEARTRLRELE